MLQFKRLFILFFVNAIFILGLSAQNSSFLITSSGDTLYGAIQFSNGNALLKSEQGEKVFSPDEANYFYLGNAKAYQSIGFKGEDKFFAQVVVQGKVSYLFYQKRKIKRHYLFTGQQLFRLIDREQTVQTDYGPKTKIIQEHRLTLERIMGGCTSILPQIKKSYLSYNYIAKLVISYNNECGGGVSDQMVSNEYKKRQASWGILAGFHTTYINFDTKSRLIFGAQHLAATEFTASSGITLGAFVQLPLSGIKKNLSLRGEVQWRSLSYQGTSEFQEIRADSTPPQLTFNDVSFSFHSITLAALPKLDFGKGAWRPFISAGPSVSALVNTNSLRLRTQIIEGGNNIVEERIGVGFKEIEMGLVIGAGVNYLINPIKGKSIILETRWTAGTGIDNLRPSISNSQTLSAIIAYTF